MLVNNLEIGKKYRYKEMCGLLQEVEKARGKSRNLQLKDWARYFKFHKPNPNGWGFIVDEIYDVPKEKIDNRGKSEGSRNNYKGIYEEYIDILLLQYLKREKCKLEDNYIVYTTNNKIAEATGIVNHNYRTAFSNRKEFYTIVNRVIIKDNKYCVMDVFDWIKTKIREIVKASLDRLQKVKKIDYEPCYLIYMQHTMKKAAEDELKVIHFSEEETMREMGIENKKQIDNSYKLSKEFNEKVLKKVNEELDYIESIFKGYSIALRNDVHLKNDEETDQLMIKLNSLVLKFLSGKAEKIQKKTIKEKGLENWFGERNQSWEPWVFYRMDERYIEYCWSLINILCNINYLNIVSEIESYKINTTK